MAFCRAGDLYEIERWIGAGKSLRTSIRFTMTPLHTAVELGFHSLVKLLVRNETCQETKDQALLDAVSKKRLDLIELLVAHGAQTRSVPFADVLLTGKPQTIRFFLKNGADVISGSPFAAAFRARVGAALRPYIDYKKAHLEIATELQEQADRALRQLAFEGDLEWISLLLSAGADPRSCGPSDDGCEDPACNATAFQEACHGDHLDVLKRFNPDPARDDLSDLLSCAVALGSNETIQ